MKLSLKQRALCLLFVGIVLVANCWCASANNYDQDPNYLSAAIELYDAGVNLQCQGKTEEALNCYNQSLKLEPRMYEAWSNIGIIYFERKNFQESEKAFISAVQLDTKGNSTSTFLSQSRLGDIYASQGKTSDAESAYKKALKTDYSKAKAPYIDTEINYAQLLRRLNRTTEAQEIENRIYQHK